MVYFPLVVVYCQRFHRSAGLGTLAATMLPYSLTFLVAWTGFLLLWWFVLELPLGLG
jgi:aminobenzoyl-glutamate transport protein